MYILKSWLLILLLCILQPATADIQDHFSTIKSDPHALYAFFKAMPKGGELHYHLTGGASAETMLSLAALSDYCIDPKTFIIQKTNTNCNGVSASMLTKNPDLYNQTIRAWSMKQFVPGDESAHDHFFSGFFKFTPIAADYSPELLVESMQRAAAQHELYMEIMLLTDNANASTFAKHIHKATSFTDKQRILLANKDFQTNIIYTVKESQRILSEARHHLGCDSHTPDAACALTVKFQYFALREQPLDAVFAQALNGFAAAAQSPNIVGINLVQAEDGPLSLRDYRAQMRIFEYLHTIYPTVHIALHAGELAPQTAVSPDHLRFHIHDAIFTGHAERIGHGVDIAHEDHATALVTHMARTHIPVEINLTSNQTILDIAGITHPLNFYLAHHVPVVLSTDDEGILRTDLTQQYVDAVIHHQLDYASIKAINRNALTYSFLLGRSLWADASRSIIVPECRNLMSTTCQLYIKHSEKARLQWQLENKLIAFEKMS